MNMKIIIGSVFLGAASMLAIPAEAPALYQSFPAVDGLERGKWSFKPRGSTQSAISMCVGDPRILFQYKHPSLSCTQTPISNSAKTVVIGYVCSGNDQGNTTITKESNGLIQLQSQGVVNGQIFSVSLEGRYAGAC